MSTIRAEDRVSGRINFTAAAASRLAELLSAETDAALCLRIVVSGGSCGGFRYGFEFDDNTDANDLLIRKNGLELRVDPMSYKNLMGAHIDYRVEADGEGFVIDNPNEPAGCSCGAACSTND